MKRFIFFVSTVLLSFMLVACGGNADEDTQTNDTGNNTADEAVEGTDMEDEQTGENNTEKNNTDGAVNSDAMKQKMEELGYEEFELEVEYADNKEYKVEIELKNGMIEAELEEDINNVDIEDEEAIDKLFPFVKELNIEKDTVKEDAIAEVLDVFGLDDNYEEFKLEITFSDGVELEFEDRK